MITIHDKAVRGHTHTGWLDSQHTFSFGGFSDPTRMGFGNLRVVNEDRIIPGSGFAPHEHKDMDILTYVLSGRLRHADNQGHVSIIGAGEMQLMSAGSGIVHSEWNASEEEPAHFLQIWLIPDEMGGRPGYAQTAVPVGQDNILLAGPAGSQALLPLRSQVKLHLIRTTEGQSTALGTDQAHVFTHIFEGLATAADERIAAGDGLQIPAGTGTILSWKSNGAALIFEMPRAGKERLQ